MNKNLHREELSAFLEKKATINMQEFLKFYQQFDPSIPLNTLRWRVYELKQQGIIYSPKRGLYALNKKKSFQPKLTEKMEELANLLQLKFPYARFSIYSTKWISNFSNHIYQTNNLIVEIDGDVIDAAFHFLKEHFPNTFIAPEQKMYDYYISPQAENIIINRLHVDAPLIKVKENYYLPKLEKLIIDLLVNNPVVLPIESKEITTIIANIIDVYNINYSTLTRYANKRYVKHKIDKLLSTEGSKKNDFEEQHDGRMV